jgi:hypothetical protein
MCEQRTPSGFAATGTSRRWKTSLPPPDPASTKFRQVWLLTRTFPRFETSRELVSPAPELHTLGLTLRPPAVFGASASRPSVRSIVTEGPGPGANFHLSKPGQSADSRVPNVPAYTMMGRSLRGGPLDGAMEARSRPGPGAYVAKDDPKYRRAPAAKLVFRKPDLVEKRRREGPAPGQYRVPGSIGHQPLSTKPSSHGVPFGSSERPALARPTSDVGPNEFKTPASIGKQLLSTKKTAPATRLVPRRDTTRSSRDAVRTGPGCYEIPTATGKQALSTVRNSRSSAMSGRTKFGSFM